MLIWERCLGYLKQIFASSSPWWWWWTSVALYSVRANDKWSVLVCVFVFVRVIVQWLWWIEQFSRFDSAIIATTTNVLANRTYIPNRNKKKMWRTWGNRVTTMMSYSLINGLSTLPSKILWLQLPYPRNECWWWWSWSSIHWLVVCLSARSSIHPTNHLSIHSFIHSFVSYIWFLFSRHILPSFFLSCSSSIYGSSNNTIWSIESIINAISNCPVHQTIRSIQSYSVQCTWSIVANFFSSFSIQWYFSTIV